MIPIFQPSAYRDLSDEAAADRLLAGCRGCGRKQPLTSRCGLLLCNYCFDHLAEFFEKYLTERAGEGWAVYQAGYVYFVQRADGLVKIGTSRTRPGLRNRIRAANGTCLGVEDGGMARERQLHRRFAYLRRHGEWFAPSTALLGYIKDRTRSLQEATAA